MPERKSRISPAHWSEADRKHFMALEHTWGQPKPLACSQKGVVVTHMCGFAVRAGVEALRQGGSAADAALTTALAQIALAAGSFISYAGTMNLVYYEAATGKVSALDAGYNVPMMETEPHSIPSQPTPGGRTALVPGFMAGLEAAHRRFGKLPFGCLFEPAIYLAEEGFEAGLLARWIEFRKEVLGRLAETRSVFSKANGEFYQKGDRFRQPELAKTLRTDRLEKLISADRGARHRPPGPRTHGGRDDPGPKGGR
jgi:gamma-glutamyltranspeptidase / glutathione hydrolase